jgi:DNA-binding transcriptional ArsR family regulator
MVEWCGGCRLSLGGREGREQRKAGELADATSIADYGPVAEEAATLMKALSHEGRLLIMCHLANGERSVTELEQMLGTKQAAVSQQLARLRLEGLVGTRRNGKAIYYSIADPRALTLITYLYDLFRKAH